LTNPRAKAIGSDIKPASEVKRLMREALPADRVEDCMKRFTYVRMDMAAMTEAKMDKICRQHFGVPWDEVHHDHASTMCDTTSVATAQNHRTASMHRWPDGTPRSAKARQHDECLRVVATMYLRKSQRCPHRLITMEQPENDVFMQLAPVQALVSQGWKVLRASHCKASASAVDRRFQPGMVFPQKDSIFLASGVGPAFEAMGGLCNNDCLHRCDSAPMRHKKVICGGPRLLPEQEKIWDPREKAKIPYGHFHRLFLENCVVNGTARDLRADRTVLMAVHVAEPVKAPVGARLHAQLCHAGEQITRLTLKELGISQKVMQRACRSCMAGKMTKTPSTGHLQRGNYMHELCHADLQEYDVPDMFGNRYNLMLVEDVTRGKYAYPIKRKSDCGPALQAHCRQVKPMAVLRTDGGGEFGHGARERLRLFDEETGVLDVCTMYNIRREITIPEDHDQMGVAEAANRRAAEAARTMLYSADLPKQFWGPAVQHWVNVDRLTVNSAEGKSPYMIEHGHPPVKEVSALRVFGSRVTFYGKTQESRKLDNPGHRGVYIGTDTVNGGHKILDLESIDPRVVCTSEVWDKAWQEHVLMEPTGVTDRDLTLVADSIPRREEWVYPPVRAVHDTMRALPERGKGSMWQGYHEFFTRRAAELAGQQPRPSHNAIQRQVSREWRETGLREALRRDPVRRMQLLGERTGADTEDEQEPEEAQCGTMADEVAAAAGAEVLNTPCAICSKTESSEAYEMMLCDGCPRAYHLVCIGAPELPSGDMDRWFCKECRCEGMRVEVCIHPRSSSGSKRLRRSNHPRGATLTRVMTDGSCDIKYADGGPTDEGVCIDAFPWRPVLQQQHDPEAMINALSVSTPTMVQHDYLSAPPRSVREALRESNPFRREWAGAIKAHFASLYRKGVFVRVEKGKEGSAEVLPCMWIFTIKPDKFKARLCIVGSRSKVREDLQRSSPTPRCSMWKLVFAIGVKLGYKVYHLDLSAGFCHTVPKRQVAIRMPDGLKEDDPDGRLLVVKNLFGMPEAPHDLYVLVANYMTTYGLEQSPFDPCIYVRSKEKRNSWPPVFVCVHVDDFGAACPADWWEDFKTAFMAVFDAEDLGVIRRWMGMEMTFSEEGLYITQRRQAEVMAHRAQLTKCSNVKVPMSSARLTTQQRCSSVEDEAFMRDKPYRSFVGALGYMAKQGVRFDIAFAQKECARYNEKPGPAHWRALERILQYVRKTPNKALLFPSSQNFQLMAHCDADYNGSADERLSTTGVVIDFGGALIDSISRSQKFCSKSVGESEYGALSTCAAEILFYRQVLEHFGFPQGITGCAAGNGNGVQVWSDSQTALANCDKPWNWLSDKLKHVQNHLHFFRQYVQCKWLQLCKVPTEANRADCMTKGYDSVEKFSNAVQAYSVELPVRLQEE
jgi:hypothetical protein